MSKDIIPRLVTVAPFIIIAILLLVRERVRNYVGRTILKSLFTWVTTMLAGAVIYAGAFIVDNRKAPDLNISDLFDFFLPICIALSFIFSIPAAVILVIINYYAGKSYPAGVKIDKLLAYPNPTNGVINIICANPCDNCLLNVTDVTGRVLMQNALSGMNTRLDMSSLAAGVYYIRVSDSRKTSTVKVVRE